MAKRQTCKLFDDCVWAPIRGSYRRRCSLCGDVDVCRAACTHYPCQDARVSNGDAFKADFEARNLRHPMFPVKGFTIEDDDATPE